MVDVAAFILVVLLGVAIMFPLHAKLSWLFSAVTWSYRAKEDEHLDNVGQVVSAVGGGFVVLGLIALVARLT